MTFEKGLYRLLDKTHAAIATAGILQAESEPENGKHCLSGPSEPTMHVRISQSPKGRSHPEL